MQKLSNNTKDHQTLPTNVVKAEPDPECSSNAGKEGSTSSQDVREVDVTLSTEAGDRVQIKVESSAKCRVSVRISTGGDTRPTAKLELILSDSSNDVAPLPSIAGESFLLFRLFAY